MDPSSLLLLGLMIVIFYFLLIRPQQKRLKQHQELIRSLQPGDEVVTVGGIFGTVERLGDDNIWIEVAAGTVLRLSRQAVSRKVTEPAEQGTGAGEPTEADAAE